MVIKTVHIIYFGLDTAKVIMPFYKPYVKRGRGWKANIPVKCNGLKEMDYSRHIRLLYHDGRQSETPDYSFEV